MNERASRSLLLLEAVVLLGPVTLVTAMYAWVALQLYAGGLRSEPIEAHAAPVFTFAGLLIQVCGWRMIIAFLLDGRKGLLALHASYFWITSVGATVVLLAIVVAVLSATEIDLPESAPLLGIGAMAAPAL